MGQTRQNVLPRRLRLTPRGKMRIQAPASSPLHGRMSAHLYDLLQMCGDGMGVAQLRQFMPPQTLRESLLQLLEQQFIEPAPEAEPAGPVDLVAA